VDTLDWEEKKKERCKKFLVAEYTSSDESEVSEDENGCNGKRFVVKRAMGVRKAKGTKGLP